MVRHISFGKLGQMLGGGHRRRSIEYFTMDNVFGAFVSTREFVVESKLITHGGTTTIEIEEGTRVGSGVRVRLNGGTVRIGRSCMIEDLVEIVPSQAVEIGNDVSIGRLSRLQSDTAKLHIADGCIVGTAAHLWAHTGQIEIGTHTVVGGNTTWIGTGDGISTSSECSFDHNVSLDAAGGRITIAEGTGIGPNSVLYGHGGLTIGKGCAIAGLTMIVPANHVFSDHKKPLREQGVRPMPIKIGDDVWIGAGVSILGNTTIGRRAVVGAGAVVVGRNVPDGEVVVGIPARSAHSAAAKFNNPI